jgi:histidine decarboxylase
MMSIEVCVIKSQLNGEIDYDDLEIKLIQNNNRPALFNLNIGTTVKAASDNVDFTV